MKLLQIVGAAIALATLAACANGTTMVTNAPSVERPAFQAAQVEAAQHAVEGDAEQIALFETKLREGLAAAGFADGPGLTLRYRLIQYERGSQALRYVVGLGVGRGSLTFEVTYLDQAGSELGRVNVGGDISGGLLGGGFGEATTKAAQEAVDYAAQNFKD